MTRDEANLAARKKHRTATYQWCRQDKQQKAGNNVGEIFQGMHPRLPLQMTSPEREVLRLDTIHGASDTRFIAGLTKGINELSFSLLRHLISGKLDEAVWMEFDRSIRFL